tara:strand:+ start:193 stop:399 length:207 start_codon:yes stop_codon:yes gene_type:complete
MQVAKKNGLEYLVLVIHVMKYVVHGNKVEKHAVKNVVINRMTIVVDPIRPWKDTSNVWKCVDAEAQNF